MIIGVLPQALTRKVIPSPDRNMVSTHDAEGMKGNRARIADGKLRKKRDDALIGNMVEYPGLTKKLPGNMPLGVAHEQFATGDSVKKLLTNVAKMKKGTFIHLPGTDPHNLDSWVRTSGRKTKHVDLIG